MGKKSKGLNSGKISTCVAGTFKNNHKVCIFILQSIWSPNIVIHCTHWELSLSCTWVCRQQSQRKFSNSSHNSSENLEVFSRSECSSATNTDAKVYLSEAVGSLQTKGPSEGQRYRACHCCGICFSDGTDAVHEGRQTAGAPICDPFSLSTMQDVTQRGPALLSVSWPHTLPNLCPINFIGTDIFCGNQSWITTLFFMLFELLKLLFPLD